MKTILKKIFNKFPYVLQKYIFTEWFYFRNGFKVFKRPIRVDGLPEAHDTKSIKLVGFLKTYNEVASGNLERVLRHMQKICDEVVVCDCESTDNSLEIIKKYTNHILLEHNDFKKELFTKQKMLDYALQLNPDWIIWLDADEVFDREGESGGIRRLCSYGDKNNIDGFELREYNLWESIGYYRVDELWGQVRKVNLWKNNGYLHFDLREGLHRPQHPLGLSNIKFVSTKLIHYGFASPKIIEERYQMYKRLGQEKYLLERMKNPIGIRLKSFNPEWFPE